MRFRFRAGGFALMADMTDDSKSGPDERRRG
jgi:hypothetical protein